MSHDRVVYPRHEAARDASIKEVYRVNQKKSLDQHRCFQHRVTYRVGKFSIHVAMSGVQFMLKEES